MKTATVATAALALALATGVASPVRAAPPPCTPAGDCTHYKNLVTFPAHSLSYGFGAFALHPRGLDWPDNTGTATLTVRSPPGFHGDKVRLTFVYEVRDPVPGTIIFGVTAISFHHGSGFETYGGFLSDTFNAPDSTSELFEQSVTVEPGQGWDADGPWWYFEINRQGTYNAGLRLMAVTLEY